MRLPFQRLRSFPRATLLLLGVTVVCLGCEPDAPLGREALSHTADLLNEFPQRYAGEHSQAVAQWIARRLPAGAEIETFQTPIGTLANVHYTRPDAVAVLVSHFDTKRGIEGFVGANDGGSTTGLLIAMAWEGRLPVNYLFLDGEESVERYSMTDGLLGSWQVARSGRYKNLPIIVLDMLGDRHFTPMLANNGTAALKHRIAAIARDIDFPLTETGDIIDDHVPFLEEGYRVVDLIDFQYSPWHTAEDTLENLSADSLDAVVRLLRRVVKDLKKEPLK